MAGLRLAVFVALVAFLTCAIVAVSAQDDDHVCVFSRYGPSRTAIYGACRDRQSCLNNGVGKDSDECAQGETCCRVSKGSMGFGFTAVNPMANSDSSDAAKPAPRASPRPASRYAPRRPAGPARCTGSHSHLRGVCVDNAVDAFDCTDAGHHIDDPVRSSVSCSSCCVVIPKGHSASEYFDDKRPFTLPEGPVCRGGESGLRGVCLDGNTEESFDCTMSSNYKVDPSINGDVPCSACCVPKKASAPTRKPAARKTTTARRNTNAARRNTARRNTNAARRNTARLNTNASRRTTPRRNPAPSRDTDQCISKSGKQGVCLNADFPGLCNLASGSTPEETKRPRRNCRECCVDI